MKYISLQDAGEKHDQIRSSLHFVTDCGVTGQVLSFMKQNQQPQRVMKFPETICGYSHNSNLYPTISEWKPRKEIFAHSWKCVPLTNSTMYQIHDMKLFSYDLKCQQELLLNLSFISLMECNCSNTFYPIFKLSQCWNVGFSFCKVANIMLQLHSD